jgi:hypothetical protein
LLGECGFRESSRIKRTALRCRSCRSRSTAANPLCYNEVTLITLTQGSNKAWYTSYRLGQVIASGGFTWTSGTGTTVSFGVYY